MSSDQGFGEFFQREAMNIKSEKDALVCCVHHSLISKGYGCIGNGARLPEVGAVKSEELPSGWAAEESCTLMYQHQSPGLLFLVKALNQNCVILASFLSEKTCTLKVNPSDFVANDFTSLDSSIRNLDQLWTSLEANQLKDFGVPEQDSTCSEPLTLANRQHECALKNLEYFVKIVNRGQCSLFTDELNLFKPDVLGSPLGVPLAPPSFGSGSGPRIDPVNVGHSDLGPLSGGVVGGMIFDPMRPGYPTVGGTGEFGGSNLLPRGSVPAGARFDPFGPPDLDPTGLRNPDAINQTAGTDPDDLSPPGFDDMLM